MLFWGAAGDPAVSKQWGNVNRMLLPAVRGWLLRTRHPRGGQLAWHQKEHTPEALLQVLSLSLMDTRGFVKSA